MIKIHKDIFVGNKRDYETTVKGKDGWAVVQATQRPYHKRALGYSGRGAPKNHSEYLVAKRDNRLILNMIDVHDPEYFSRELIEPALDFIDEQLSEGNQVLIHCSQGRSRAPSLGLLYLATRTDVLPDSSLEEAEKEFKKIYPAYSPKSGIRGHLQGNWDYYSKESN